MANPGTELNKRVWKLFERAGFNTKPNTNSSSEHVVDLGGGKKRTVDLLAEIPDLNVKLIGENTTSPSLPEPITTYIHTHMELMKAEAAKAGLLVYTNKKPTLQDVKYAKENLITIWGESDLKYFEAVADSIGVYARYEMCKRLGVDTEEENHISNVLAIKFKQPTSVSPNFDLFMFALSPEKLLKTCVIFRRAQGDGDAYQRMLRKTRLAGVKKFVTQSDALLPPSIIVHLDESVLWERIPHPEKNEAGEQITLSNPMDYELGILKLPLSYASLELIDGQHRLYGFVGTNSATRNSFNLPVMALQNLTPIKRKDTFVSINDNSRRMDANLVAYLKYTDVEADCQADQELMAIKIVVELNKRSPFADKVRLLDIGEQRITLKGFSGYELKSLLGPRGLLRIHYQHDSKSYVMALRLFFGVLSSIFPTAWKNPDKYIIATNRGVSAFLKLLTSILRTTGKQLDKNTIIDYMEALCEEWPEPKWETVSLRSSYVGSKGWSDFHRDLVAAIQKKHPDFRA